MYGNSGEYIRPQNKREVISIPAYTPQYTAALNDLERRNGRYFALFHRIRVAFRAHWHCVKVIEDIPKLSTTEM